MPAASESQGPDRGSPELPDRVDVAGGASQAAIEHHYDVGSDFYRLWLDERMVYSCALWDGEIDDDLAGAQLAKLAWHASAARADGVDRVLDVGCGWGAMLLYLIQERGVKQVTGLTLSSSQASAVPVSPSVEVRLESWRDHQPSAPYDAIVSVGAFEHFARPDLSRAGRIGVYSGFFRACHGWLVAGGSMSLQSIAYEDFDMSGGPVTSFFSEEVFPESALPRLSEIAVAAEPYFRIRALRSDPEHYEHTLEIWQRRLEANAGKATEIVGREVYRRYLRYLRVSRAMFGRRVCTLHRLALERRPEVLGLG
jgi:cyclopropane-fatty-acyl-phospholipid synthase